MHQDDTSYMIGVTRYSQTPNSDLDLDLVVVCYLPIVYINL